MYDARTMFTPTMFTPTTAYTRGVDWGLEFRSLGIMIILIINNDNNNNNNNTRGTATPRLALHTIDFRNVIVCMYVCMYVWM